MIRIYILSLLTLSAVASAQAAPPRPGLLSPACGPKLSGEYFVGRSPRKPAPPETLAQAVARISNREIVRLTKGHESAPVKESDPPLASVREVMSRIHVPQAREISGMRFGKGLESRRQELKEALEEGKSQVETWQAIANWLYVNRIPFEWIDLPGKRGLAVRIPAFFSPLLLKRIPRYATQVKSEPLTILLKGQSKLYANVLIARDLLSYAEPLPRESGGMEYFNYVRDLAIALHGTTRMSQSGERESAVRWEDELASELKLLWENIAQFSPELTDAIDYVESCRMGLWVGGKWMPPRRGAQIVNDGILLSMKVPGERQEPWETRFVKKGESIRIIRSGSESKVPPGFYKIADIANGSVLTLERMDGSRGTLTVFFTQYELDNQVRHLVDIEAR